VAEPVFRGGGWWQQQDDGTWLRWNDGTSAWEPSASPPPDDGSALPPPPPMPGTAMPGQYGQYGSTAGRANVPNYLVWSILTTLLCCLPAGVVAIVYSSQVSSKLAAGDYTGAVDSSNKARTWCIVSAVAGVVGGIIWFAVFAGSGANTSFS
jgi:hypothetical protein